MKTSWLMCSHTRVGRGGVRRDWPLPDKRVIAPGFFHQENNCSRHCLYHKSACPWLSLLYRCVFFRVGSAFWESIQFFSAPLLSPWVCFYSSIAGESPCLQRFLSCCLSVILITKGDHPLSSSTRKSDRFTRWLMRLRRRGDVAALTAFSQCKYINDSDLNARHGPYPTRHPRWYDGTLCCYFLNANVSHE